MSILLMISTPKIGVDLINKLQKAMILEKEALENLDLILLCLDEIVDGRIILETDANVVAGVATPQEHLTRSHLK
ncbi:hypothetical protein L1987_08106 [Smallanthus sonchifolius]|uniref:Uncharacterized protein n=1 Tax=Smallanthus sonchifolius TaxID=185202 RepID=A0ACB9JKU4_9ASTR|nr:hypothetical protein L1987_08106 [Smallanthus sonchifolius]